ncbi:C25 family cysteine peptidase [Thiolapillus sp.]
MKRTHLFCRVAVLLPVFLASLPAVALAAGDLLWNTEVSTTDIDASNYANPPTDSFVEDGVSITIEYLFPDYPDPGATTLPYFSTYTGTVGNQTNVFLMAMDTVNGASGGQTECMRTRFTFSPAVSQLRFPLLDVDYGGWRDMILVRATRNGAPVAGSGTIVDANPTVQQGTPAGVTEYTCADIQNEFGNGLCFTGHTDNSLSGETRGNVNIQFSDFVDQLEISYCESDNASNNGQISGLGDFFWGQNVAEADKDYGDAPASYGDAAHLNLPYLEAVTVGNVDEAWQTVQLRNTYASPVVVCTYNLPSSADAPAVVRVSNALSNSFDVRLQNPGDTTAVTASSVSCLVAEEGQHTLPDGRSFEAHRVSSNITDAKGNWNGQTAVINGSYTNPVVLGQVMTFTDSRFSVFWDYDCNSRFTPPAGGAGNICIGKHVGEDPDTGRTQEQLGYIVVEAGTGSFGGVSYEAAVGGDVVQGADNAPPYSYGLTQTFEFAVATQAAMDGGDGSWAVLYGANPVGASLDLSLDEDTLGDAERAHTTEQVAYWAFTRFSPPYLGDRPGDVESGTQSTVAADGDDSAGIDDEDGVSFRSPAGGGRAEIYADVNVVNDTGGDVYVCAWLDRWTDAGGTAALDGSFDAADVADTPGVACQTIVHNGGVPTQALFYWGGLPNVSGHTYVRFRVCSNEPDCNSPVGVAVDGEVEDYRVDFDFTPTSAVVDGFRVSWQRVGDLLRNEPGLTRALSGQDRKSGTAVIRWETLQEHGTLGFTLERRQSEDEPWQAVAQETFLPGLVTAPLGGQYLLLDNEVQPGEQWSYRLTEKEVWGSERHYGPWDITIASASPAPGAATTVDEEKGHWRPWRELLSGYAGRARDVAPPAPAANVPSTALPVSANGAVQLRLRTREEGLHRVPLGELAVRLDMPEGELANQLLRGEWVLSRGGVSQAYFYAPGEQALYFAAERYSNIDTVENVYWLSPGKGSLASLYIATDEVEAVLPGSFRDQLHFEEENWLLTYVHQEEDADYGYWDYVYTLSKPRAELVLNPPAAAEASAVPGRLHVVLRGQTNLADGNDHRARIYLNGQLLDGEVEWDGNARAELTLSFDQALLRRESPVRVTVEGEVANDADYSLFFVESVDLEYERQYLARDGQLWLHDVPEGVIVTVTGFDSRDIRVLEDPLGTAPRWYSGLSVGPDLNWGWQASFISHGGDYLLSSRPLLPVVEADQPSRLTDGYNEADYLIIAPRKLAEGAQALAAYRRGRFDRVRIVWLQDIYDEFSHGRTDSQAIRDFLRTVRQRWHQVPGYVVMLGRGTLDHADRRGYGESLIPLRMAATPWGLAPSDNRYADTDGDHVPDFILGRVSVSDNNALLAYVDKLKAYESSAAGDWSRQVAVVADNPDEAGNFHDNADTLSDELESMGYGVDRLYYPDQSVGSLLRSNWAAGRYGYVAYDGHGSATMLGNRAEDFLSVATIGVLDNGSRLPVFTAFTCAAGDSSYPGQLGLGDSLTLKPDGGAIAGFVPSGLSLDAPASLLSGHYSRALLGEWLTVGEAARVSLVRAARQGIADFMLDIYGISGDPAVEIRH